MNILFYRYNSVCEPDIIEVLTRKGHSIDTITAEVTNKEISPKEMLSCVSETLKKKKYQMVFSINFFPVVSEVCNIFKISYVCWIVDSPIMELYSYSIRNKYNRIFLFDYALYQEFFMENPECIYYLPLGANYERLDSLITSITEKEKEKYTADVSFIGSLYTEKCPYNRFVETNTYLRGYLDGIIEAQLKVYGYNFLEECLPEAIVEEFKRKVPFYQFPEKASQNDRAALAHLYLGNKVTEQERLRILKTVSENFTLDLYTGSDINTLPKVNYRGLAKTMTEMPKIFHLSKINLNLTSKPIRTGLPQRIWDILGAGGFVLTNFQSELPEYFEIGKELETYTSEDDLVEKISYYLSHEEERKEIARKGYEKAKRCYSLDLRLEQILKQV